MADIFHEVAVKESRLMRRCSWCHETIYAGEPYRAYSFRHEGEFGRVTMHPECMVAMDELVAKEGGWLEWSEGDFNRGCGCEGGNCKCNKASNSKGVSDD